MYRLRNGCRKVCIVFYAHPISGVLFCLPECFFFGKRMVYAPEGVLFVFRGKPSDMSQTENSVKPKGEFFMMTTISILKKDERGNACEEIEI